MILSLLLAISLSVHAAEPPSPADVGAAAEDLRSTLEAVMTAQGGGSVARLLRERAEGGLDLAPLRRQVLAANGHEPLTIDVPVHPTAKGRVVFANRMLRDSGVDFFVYRAVEDDGLLPQETPGPGDEKSYRRWRATRAIVLPLMGFAATLAEAAQGGGFEAVTAAALASAFAVVGLEVQFSLFSNQWVKLWKQDTPLIPWRIARPFAEAETSRLKQRLNGLVDGVNGALGVVTRAHAWNFTINWAYTLIVYGAGVVGSYVAGHPDLSFPFMKVLVGSSVFYASFGLFQTAMASAASRGEVSELLRYQIESVALKWNSLWRMVSLVPGLEGVGLALQTVFIGLVTVPTMARLKGADAYARETARLFGRNGGVEGAAAGRCERLLAASFEATPLRRGARIWETLKGMGRAAARAVGRLVPARRAQISMIFIDHATMA